MQKPETRPVMVPPSFVMEAYAKELDSSVFLSMRILFQLRSCVGRVNGELSQWLGSEALSPGRMQMLMILWASDGPVLQRDLVQWLGLSRASVSELIETLGRDGLVETRPDERHGRRILVMLTAAGRRTAREQIHANATRLDETFSSLSAEDKRVLADMLGRLCSTD